MSVNGLWAEGTGTDEPSPKSIALFIFGNQQYRKEAFGNNQHSDR
jgi:hypothetical protein